MNINHKQLTFAREYRRYSQTELSSMIDGLSQPNLSKFEKGLNTLSEELLRKIINHLDFPFEFLNKNISNESETAHFRKRTTITKTRKTEIENSYKLIAYIVDELSESLLWPEFTLQTFNLEEGYTPEYAAKHTRKILGLKPNEPVRNINNLLESKGIIVVEYEADENFDGVSLVTDNDQPIIVINKLMSNDRKRFTLAHELGHLLMHSINNPPIPNHRNNHKIKEEEANLFAGEFLMPGFAIKPSLQNLKLSDLFELKAYWLTSMASLIVRANTLECLTPERKKYLNIEFSRRGYRRHEGEDVYIDDPVLYKKGYSMHKNEFSYSDSELSEAFKLPIDIIKKYCDNSRFTSKLRVLV